MNKEVIKKYKPEFDWWLDGGEVIHTYDLVTWHKTFESTWSKCPIAIVIQDEYVEFRQAVAEGKTVEHRGSLMGEWCTQTIGNVEFTLPVEDYRIKPNETTWTPKEGDYVVYQDGIKQIERVTIAGNLMYTNIFMDECWLSAKDCKLWQPKEGDVVVCWDNRWSEYTKNIIHINTYMKLKDVLDFDNCIPYIGQNFEDMK